MLSRQSRRKDNEESSYDGIGDSGGEESDVEEEQGQQQGAPKSFVDYRRGGGGGGGGGGGARRGDILGGCGSGGGVGYRSKEDALLSAPLPLLSFKVAREDIPKARTIWGTEINSSSFLEPPLEAMEGTDESLVQSGLQDPQYTRLLSKWFVSRSQKELTLRQSSDFFSSSSSNLPGDGSGGGEGGSGSLEAGGSAGSTAAAAAAAAGGGALIDLITFNEQSEDSPPPTSFSTCTCSGRRSETTAAAAMPTTTTGEEDLSLPAIGGGKESSSSSSNPPQPPAMSVVCMPCLLKQSLRFSSNFECGNLAKAVRVEGRETLLTPRSFEFMHNYMVPATVHQEYDLTLRKDLNTSGNIQWYFFCCTSPPESAGIKYPLRVRFQITNMQKKDALYNYGCKPTVFAMNSPTSEKRCWRHEGEDICYFINGLTSLTGGSASSSAASTSSDTNVGGEEKKKKKKLRQYYSLCFTYTFVRPDTVYFSHAFPYTYTFLQEYLHTLESNERISHFMRRKLLCSTLAGNRCDVLTITARSSDAEDRSKKPAVIVSARVHPGESNSSFAMHGLINFLVADTPEAALLRETFVFKLVPMLNPDGVIHGNYRCSLAGTDLNRRYGDCHPAYHPSVTAMRDLLQTTHEHRGVLLYLDLHGHSKNKNAFLYGCDITQQPEKQLKAVLSTKSAAAIAAQRVYARTFPRVLSSVSNSHASGPGGAGKGPGYFSYRDCCYAVTKSKFGTGRAVSWLNLGIEGAYTVEISFCGKGNNEESRLLKRVGEKLARHPSISSNLNKIGEETARPTSSTSVAFTSSSESSSSSSGPGEAVEIDKFACLQKLFEAFQASNAPGPDAAALADLLESYRTATHYTKQNLLALGADLAIALIEFANIKTCASLSVDEGVLKSKSSSSAGVRDSYFADDVDESSSSIRNDDISLETLNDPYFAAPPTTASAAAKIGVLQTYGSTMLNKPLLTASVFNAESFSFVLSKCTSDADLDRIAPLRFKCEHEIRRSLGLEFKIVASSKEGGAEIVSADSYFPTDGGYDSGAEGSDSDPSVDNIPTSKLIKANARFRDPSSLLAALRDAEAKQRKLELLQAKRLEEEAARLKYEQQQEMLFQKRQQAQMPITFGNSKKPAPSTLFSTSKEQIKKKQTYAVKPTAQKIPKHVYPSHNPSYKLERGRAANVLSLNATLEAVTPMGGDQLEKFFARQQMHSAGPVPLGSSTTLAKAMSASSSSTKMLMSPRRQRDGAMSPPPVSSSATSPTLFASASFSSSSPNNSSTGNTSSSSQSVNFGRSVQVGHMIGKAFAPSPNAKTSPSSQGIVGPGQMALSELNAFMDSLKSTEYSDNKDEQFASTKSRGIIRGVITRSLEPLGTSSFTPSPLSSLRTQQQQQQTQAREY